MSQSPQRFQVPDDVVTRLYLTSESMIYLAKSLPEEEGGLAHIIRTLGDDVHYCAALMDDNEE